MSSIGSKTVSDVNVNGIASHPVTGARIYTRSGDIMVGLLLLVWKMEKLRSPSGWLVRCGWGVARAPIENVASISKFPSFTTTLEHIISNILY